MVSKKIIVLGGGSYGLAAAACARQLNEHADIVFIEHPQNFRREKLCSVDQDLGKLEQEIDLSLNEFSKRFNIIVKNSQVLAVDVDAQFLLIKSKNPRKEHLRFDSLIFAGNPKAIEPRTSGPRITGCQSQEDFEKIQRAIKEGARHAVVLGLSGKSIKLAESLKRAGLKVVLIGDNQVAHFSLVFSKHILNQLSLAYEIKLGKILSMREEGLKVQLNLACETLITDLVIDLVEDPPKVSLLVDAGAGLDQNLIQVDEELKTTLPNIFACGKAILGPVVYMEHQPLTHTEALISAHVAGFNAALTQGSLKKIKPSAHSSVLKVGNTLFARTGLSELQAFKRFGADNVFSTTVYQDLCIRLIVERKKQCIVGAEVLGEHGVLRRIDLLSMVVTEGFSPAKLFELDLIEIENSYAIDPLKEAARRAHLTLQNKFQTISPDLLALWAARGNDFSLVNVGELKDSVKKALHVPLENLRERLSELQGPKPVVLYSSGEQSFLAQQALAQRGLANTYHLDGGIKSFEIVFKD